MSKSGKGKNKDQVFKLTAKNENEDDQITELQCKKKILEEKYSNNNF